MIYLSAQLLSGFLSTPSARRATGRYVHNGCGSLISIHALREEGDVLRRVWRVRLADFYPRPPRGGRQAERAKGVESQIFLSTPSARRATELGSTYASWDAISIHALREEGDLNLVALMLRGMLFLSTPSARRATSGFL